jgi:tetratricopeptide (TPR) repeat protein
LAELDAAIQAGHDLARAWYQRGLTLVAMERIAEAVESYRSAIAHRPQYLQALVNLAGLHLQRNESTAAAELIHRAERLVAPDDVVFLLTRSTLHRQQHDARAAIECARRAVAVAPTEPAAWEELGLCLLMDPAGAHESVSSSARCLELEPARAGAAHNLAVALDRLGRAVDALAHADNALARRPHDVQFQQTKACILLHLGRVHEAMPLLVQVERAQPGSFEAQYNLACALARTGRPDQAVLHVARALDLVPPHQRKAFRAHIPNDPDLEALRRLPNFRALL